MPNSASPLERLREENAAAHRRVAELEGLLAKYHAGPAPMLRIDKLLDNLPGMVYRCRNDPHWSMEYVSAGGQKLTACSPEDLKQGRVTYASLILPEDRQRVWDKIQRALKNEHAFELVYRIRDGRGEIKWVWERGWGVWANTGELLTLEGFITDITHYKDAEQALSESEQRYRRIVESSQEGIWMIDIHARTTFANHRMAAMLGCDVETMQGVSMFDFMTPKWQTITRDKIPLGQPGKLEQYDVKLLRKDGSEIWALMSVNPILDEEGRYAGTLAMAVDITDRKRMEAALQEMAILDPLTGLLNRRHFYNLAEQELERLRRYRYPLAAIMADLDHFKAINDMHGHLIGDQVLQTAATLFRENLRQPDLLCRYGGEEFAILLPQTDLRTASITAERLRATLEARAIETDQGTLHLTVSLGVAAIGMGASIGLETLLDYADRMLYVAKEGGRNQVAIWDLATNRKVMTRRTEGACVPSVSSAVHPEDSD